MIDYPGRGVTTLRIGGETVRLPNRAVERATETARTMTRFADAAGLFLQPQPVVSAKPMTILADRAGRSRHLARS